jgi:hypothetical protein
MKNYFLLLTFCFLFSLPAKSNESIPLKIEKNISAKDYFVYYGFADIITKEMEAFTKKYNVGFKNNGCVVLNKSRTETHNQNISKNLTKYLGHTNWVKDLPIKVMGVN